MDAIAELVVACLSPELLERKLGDGGYRYTDGELEKRCGRCREYWPADSDFFYASRNTSDGLNCNCKACCSEHRYPQGRNTTNQKGSNT